jgi:hypothetical protein
MVAKRSGFISCIARNTGANFGAPLWTPIIRAKGIKGNRAPAGTPDTSDRQVNVYTTIPTRKKISYEFDADWDGGAGLTALRTAFLARSAIDLAALDAQPGSSGTGYRGDWAVPLFSLDFPINGTQKLSTQIVPHGNYTSGQAVAAYTDTVGAGTAETPGTKKLGRNASINNSSGVPFTGIMDFKLNLEWATWDASDRANVFERINMEQIKVSVEGTFIWDSTEFADWATAFANETALDLYVLDGAYATTGSWGCHTDWALTDFPKADELTDGQKVTFKLEPRGNFTTALAFLTI